MPANSADSQRPQTAGTHAAQENDLRIVLGFVRLAFIEKQVPAAFSQYIAAHYIQHNPYATADGAETSLAMLEGFLGQFPDLTYEVKRAASDGGLVFVHAHVKTNAQDPGAAVVDIFRLEGSHIVEHWDVLQQIDPQAPNPNAPV